MSRCQFQIPEFVLGVLVTVAVVAVILMFANSSLVDWLSKDAAGFFTFGLVMVGMVQVAMFFRQLNLMREGMKDTAIAAEAAREGALASRGQAKISSDTLTKVQRPYVYVYGLSRLKTSNAVPAVTPYVEYSVANYGQTPAVIENVCAGFDSGIIPSAPLRVDENHDLLTSSVLPPNQPRMGLRELLPEAFIAEDLGVVVNIETAETYPLPKVLPDEELFFRVAIRYRGPFAEGYETSATWIYRPGLNQFVELNDPAYNFTK